MLSDITSQKNAEEKLRFLANYDFLTNFPNRKLVLEKIGHSIKAYKYNRKKSALFFIDLDKFKQVNDSLGHSAGDELLCGVADILVSNVKSRDIVARQSGDEFMILINDFSSIDNLSHLAQRLNQCLSIPVEIQGTQVSITSSIGIAIFPDDGKNSDDLIQKSDWAMIHAKNSGRSQFQFFTQNMTDKAQARLKLEADLRQAVADNKLINYYQPIMQCEGNRVLGFELLLRWPTDNGMISPGVFIPVAEDIGLISQMTEDAVERALQDYSALEKVHADIYISINLSTIHILQKGLSDTLESLLEKYDLPAKVLRLEITEGILFADHDIALIRLRELMACGFMLLLDDFCTGYSSFTYLSQFPIDVLKIDQSFVFDIDSNPMNKAIIKSIVSLAENINLSCIAEGVETQEQLDYLQSLSCKNIQGYFFSKPKPLHELVQGLIVP